MTTRYGFKVHSLELARGLRGRRRLKPATSQSGEELKQIQAGKTGTPAARDYVDDLVAVLEDLRDRDEALDDVPKMLAVEGGANSHVPSDEAGTPRMLVEEVTSTGRRVSVRVEYGHLGYSHRAVGKTRTDAATLDDKSPVEFFRCEILVPSTGEQGLIVAEVVANASALPTLVAWINHEMRARFGDDSFPRLMAPHLADSARLDKLLNGDTVAEIQLTKKSKAGDGLPKENSIKLIETVRTSSKMKTAQNMVKRWFTQQRHAPYTEAERKQEVDLLAELVDQNVAALDFTDGIVKLDEGNGRFVHVSPSRAKDVFVYPISESRPDRAQWETATQPQALAMAKAGKVSVAWS